MHILITGGNGFIGKSLALTLLSSNSPFVKKLSRLSLMDLDFNASNFPDSPKLNLIKGSFAEAKLIKETIAQQKIDLIYHLASVPSGLSESNHELGVQVNIQGMINLLALLHAQGNVPKVVFASSIAVYGRPNPPLVDENTLPKPGLSYGYQKLIGENLVEDYSHKKWIDGCSIRLPGIVTRPPEPNGAVSIFFSDLIRNLSQQKPFTCPVSSDATSWLMSIQCCVDNLLAAAQMNFENKRTWTLPAMLCSIDELVQSIGKFTKNESISDLMTYAPDRWVEENFGSYPPLVCPQAELIGFKSDGNLARLVQRAL